MTIFGSISISSIWKEIDRRSYRHREEGDSLNLHMYEYVRTNTLHRFPPGFFPGWLDLDYQNLWKNRNEGMHAATARLYSACLPASLPACRSAGRFRIESRNSISVVPTTFCRDLAQLYRRRKLIFVLKEKREKSLRQFIHFLPSGLFCYWRSK